MKLNMPVTQVEVFLEPGKPIVTRTDLQGRIVYANESFVRISGFPRTELIGVNHNVVRHPDMPPEAFADLWATVQAGRPWRGLVKNRSRNGDFYWVEAYVTPLTQQGRVVGYMSVRNTPSRAEVAEAEALYRAVREKRTTFPATPVRDHAAGFRWQLAGLLLGTAACLPLAALLPGAWSWSAVLAGGGALAALAWIVQVRLLGGLARAQLAVRAIDEGRVDEALAPEHGPFSGLSGQLESLRIHVRAMFADVLVGADAAQSRAEELDRALGRLASGSGRQTETVAQVAAAMEEVSVSVNEITENNERSVNAVGRTSEVAGSAMAAMQANGRSASQVVEAVRSTQAQIGEVSSSVARISEVTRIIRDIAGQTNLLALNAAIEAARAGEQGRGFAVVADEVRKLAERTSSSTSHIAAAVEEISDRTERAVQAMDRAAENVVQSSTAIEASNTDFVGIQESSQEAVRLSGEISGMLGRQAAAACEVARSMERISLAVNAGDENIREIGDAAAQLRVTVGDLHQLVQHLKTAL